MSLCIIVYIPHWTPLISCVVFQKIFFCIHEKKVSHTGLSKWWQNVILSELSFLIVIWVCVWCFAYIIRDSHWLWSEFVQSVTSPGACHCSNCIWVNQCIITSDKGSRGSGGVSPAYGSRWESVYLLIRFLCVPLSLITQPAISDFPSQNTSLLAEAYVNTLLPKPLPSDEHFGS